MNKKIFFDLRFLYNLILIAFIIIALIASFFCLRIAVALMFAFFFYFSYLFVNLLNFKSEFRYLPIVSIAAIIAFLILLGYKPYIGKCIKYGVLLFEVILVIFIGIIRLLEKRIRNRFTRKNKMKNMNLSIRLNQFFLTTKYCQYVFSIHLFIVFIYKICLVEYQTSELSRFLFSQLNVSLAFIISTYEYIRVLILQAENWLPIVSENGDVIGKIAYSASISSAKQFLHPVVRIALIHNNRLYLSKRNSDDNSESDKLDLPLESFVKYRQTLDETTSHILQKKNGLNNLSGKFVFKYIWKKTLTHRLVYLYMVQIPSLQQAETINFKGGKWWTEKHIEENLNKGIFSECFEMEYNVLKNTILLANRVINQSSKEKEL